MIAWLALGCDPQPCAEPFVAMQEDFADYERWRSFELDAPDPRLGVGARTVYVSDLPPRGGGVFPVCTAIVKVGEAGDDPTQWLMVGMAKRGGGTNSLGAAGWEWFDLDLTADAEVVIDWRGPVPPEGQGYECVLGEDEPSAEGVGDCNTCHLAGADTDYVLTPALAERVAD